MVAVQRIKFQLQAKVANPFHLLPASKCLADE